MEILEQKIALRQLLLKSKKAIIYFVGIVFLFSCSEENKIQHLPYYHTADFTPIWAEEQSVNIDTLHAISDFSFVDQENKVVNKETVKGKIYIVNFFFTACTGICPKMTNNIETVTKVFKNDPNVVFISHSVAPKADSVKALNAYADFHKINSTQWHLVTGDSEDINNLARKSYFIEKSPGLSANGNEFLHTENIVLIDKKGHIRGLYKGTVELEMEKLIEEITVLQRE